MRHSHYRPVPLRERTSVTRLLHSFCNNRDARERCFGALRVLVQSLLRTPVPQHLAPSRVLLAKLKYRSPERYPGDS
jgi:hypothetical protein